MTNKEALKEYLTKYGEINALKDIASMLQDLSHEWAESQVVDNVKTPIVYALSDAAFKLADATLVLEKADAVWKNNTLTEMEREEQQREAMQVELDAHMKFFRDLSISGFAKLYKKNQKLFVDKLKRIEFLQKTLAKPSDDTKKD
jgi:hypothetical protein